MNTKNEGFNPNIFGTDRYTSIFSAYERRIIKKHIDQDPLDHVQQTILSRVRRKLKILKNVPYDVHEQIMAKHITKAKKE